MKKRFYQQKTSVTDADSIQSILSRPPAYRELELDEYGNVVSIAKIDPDKFAPRRYQSEVRSYHLDVMSSSSM